MGFEMKNKLNFFQSFVIVWLTIGNLVLAESCRHRDEPRGWGRADMWLCSHGEWKCGGGDRHRDKQKD